jgi:lipopolysaccharide biosynthesis glycosyltransferase
VRKDIANLFKIDIGENLVGAVRDYEGIANCYNCNYERTKYRIKEIGIKNFEDYFISGVMLMNIHEFQTNFNLKSLLDLAVSKDWKQYDQDLFNYICKGKVQILDAGWDFVEDIDGVYQRLPSNLFKEYLDSEKDPKIVHFSGDRKPWLKIDSKYNADFWKYAENTKYIDELKKIKKKFE